MAATAFVAFSPLTAEAPVAPYLAVVLFSAIGGLIPATLFALAVHVAPDEHTVSTTVGWMQQCSSAGQFLGPPLVGLGGRHGRRLAVDLGDHRARVLVGLVLSSRIRYQRA